MSQQATALDIINGALRILAVKGDDVALSNNEANDALFALNGLLDSYSNDGLMIYDQIRETFTLTAGHNPHTWGIGGDLNSERPMKLKSALAQVSGTTEWPIVILTADDYAAIRLKTLQTNYPQYCYLENSYPLAKLWLYPVPATGITIACYSEKPLTQITNLTTSINFPPGWIRALRYNLAVELANEYQQTAGNETVRIAVESKKALQKTNLRPSTLQLDVAMLGKSRKRYNIFTDNY